MLGWYVPEVLGVGYAYVSQALNGQMLLSAMALLVLLKVIATATCYSSGNAGGISRQDEMKIETAAEAARSLKGPYSFEKEEAALGPGMLLELKTLTDGNLFCSALQSSQTNTMPERLASGNVSFGSASVAPESLALPLGEQPRTAEAAVSDLLSFAPNSYPVLITDADEQGARFIAERYPALRVVVYRSASDSPSDRIMVGNTALVTTGRHGKNAIALTLEDGKVTGYNVMQLGPDVPDDPAISRIYLRYRNLYFLGMAHGVVGFLLYLVVPDTISHHLSVGPKWFSM